MNKSTHLPGAVSRPTRFSALTGTCAQKPSDALGRARVWSRGLVTILILIVGSPALAKSLKVPDMFATIQEAVDVASIGDVILVRKGVYAGPLVVDGKLGLVIKKSGPGKAVIDLNGQVGHGIHLDNCQDVRLSGLEVIHCDQNAIDVRDSEFIRIDRCVVSESNSGVNVCDVVEARVEKCTVRDVNYNAVFLEDCDGAIVKGNKLKQVATGYALEVCHSVDVSVVGNRISESPAGIDLDNADLAVVKKNRVKTTTSDGILVDGDDMVLVKNKVSGGTEGALVLVNGSNSVFKGNKLKKGGADGFVVTGSANTFKGNQSMKCGGNGFRVDGGANEFIGNKAKNNGSFDLSDSAGSGANVYKKNKFGTEVFIK